MGEHGRLEEQGQEQGQPGGPVVVGVDGSESSKEALRWAARMAAAEGLKLRALTTWEYPQAYNSPVDVNWRPDVDAETILDDTLTEVFGDERPSGLETEVVHGSARTVLLDASKGRLPPRPRQPGPRGRRGPAAGVGELRLRRARPLSRPRPPRAALTSSRPAHRSAPRRSFRP